MMYENEPKDPALILARRDITGYLNLREYLAAKALAGLAFKGTSPKTAARKALEYADALIQLINDAEIR
jgi:hypothetical protein